MCGKNLTGYKLKKTAKKEISNAKTGTRSLAERNYKTRINQRFLWLSFFTLLRASGVMPRYEAIIF